MTATMGPAQQTLDVEAGRQARDAAIEQVDANAAEDWKTAADRAIQVNAELGVEFTNDQVWLTLEGWGVLPPREPRALGARVKKAVTAGVIRKTGNWYPSERPVCHGRIQPGYVGDKTIEEN